MSLRHSRTWSRSQSRSGLSGNAASGQESGWNVFWLQQVDSSGRKQTASSFSPQLTDSLPPHRLLLFGRKQSSSLFSPPDPHTKPLPGGCCCRNQVQAFDPSPDHWLKGCHFNFRPCSIPRCSSSIRSPGDTLFLKSPLRVLSHRSRLPRYCEDKIYSHPPRLSVEWMQVNHVGHKTTTAFVSVTLTTSGHNESNKNGWNLKWTTKKKACRAIYTKENRAELIWKLALIPHFYRWKLVNEKAWNHAWYGNPKLWIMSSSQSSSLF